MNTASPRNINHNTNRNTEKMQYPSTLLLIQIITGVFIITSIIASFSYMMGILFPDIIFLILLFVILGTPTFALITLVIDGLLSKNRLLVLLVIINLCILIGLSVWVLYIKVP